MHYANEEFNDEDDIQVTPPQSFKTQIKNLIAGAGCLFAFVGFIILIASFAFLLIKKDTGFATICGSFGIGLLIIGLVIARFVTEDSTSISNNNED